MLKPVRDNNLDIPPRTQMIKQPTLEASARGQEQRTTLMMMEVMAMCMPRSGFHERRKRDTVVTEVDHDHFPEKLKP